MEGLKATLGRNIRVQRRRLGLTQEELSEKAGIHYTFLGHIERGRKAPSLETLLRIARSLNASLAALFKGV